MSILVECVPNFSEGSNTETLSAIRTAIESISGVQVLDVDPGVAANRTVFTFVGSPGAVEDAAVKAIGVAGQLIDMSTHKGEHPRMGATDVCPFVPVQGISGRMCGFGKRVAERVWTELEFQRICTKLQPVLLIVKDSDLRKESTRLWRAKWVTNNGHLTSVAIGPHRLRKQVRQ